MAKKKKTPKAKPVAKAKPKKAIASKPKAKVVAKKAVKAKKAAPPPKALPKKVAKKAEVAPTPAAAPKKMTLKGTVKEKAEAPKNVLADAPAETEEAEAEEVILVDADGRRFCRVKDCDQLSTVDAYCRYHYLLYWKKIQVRKKILSEGKLERYIEELTARYPDKFLDMLRKDLRSEKEFLAAIQELEIDESANEGEFEDEAQTYIDEVRGISESTPSTGDEEGF